MPANRVILTVASSGNTGTAFALACSRQQAPCLIIVPGKSLHRFRSRTALPPFIKLVTIEDGDYSDAIDFAAAVSKNAPFHAEGGVKNVGRRDGLATVLLAAFEKMQRLPVYYFQSVGSGTGAIAALEAARRLLGSADGAATLPRLMLCQNTPFTPIYNAWQANQKSLVREPTQRLREYIRQVHADELTNWTPPYEVQGGVYDSLMASRGDALATDNASVREAMDMFLALEGIDIEPAAGVALSCLRDVAAQGKIDAESSVLLNITGGGRHRLSKDYSLIQAEPQLRLTRDSLTSSMAMHRIAALYGSGG